MPWQRTAEQQIWHLALRAIDSDKQSCYSRMTERMTLMS